MLDLTSHVTYLGIIGILVVTGTGIPIPEELPVVLAGIASASGQMNPWLAFGSCLLGSLLGDLVMYSIGYHFGHSVLRDHPWFSRFIKPEREKRIEDMINNHGLKVFFVARFLVGLRSPVFLTTGILRVPLRRFLFVDALSATCVISLFFLLAYYFAEQITGLWRWIRGFEITLTVVVVAAVAVLVWVYIRRRQLRWQRVLSRRKKHADKLQADAVDESEEVAETETAA